MWLIHSATAREQFARWSATINLMEIASEDGDRAQFDAYRTQLEAGDLPPQARAEFEIHAGLGYRRFGDCALASERFERARVSAAFSSLNALMFKAERLLAEDPNINSVQAPRPAVDIPIALKRIAAELRAMRELAFSESD